MFAEITGDLVHVKEYAMQNALTARGPKNLCLVQAEARIGLAKPRCQSQYP